MKRRYIGADIWRAAALLWVMIYHGWVLLGSPVLDGGIVLLVVMLGGETGVTMFFVLSGFGIYLSLESNRRKNGRISIKKYILARAGRILPDYYGSILLAVMLTGAAGCLSIPGIFHILAHVLFVHNLFPQTHGSVIGVLWTMGVIVQFYAAAPLLYQAVRKHPFVSLILAVTGSIFAKFLLFHLILPHFQAPAIYSFIYSRQLVTSADNFVIGMVLGRAADACSSERKHVWTELAALLLLLLWCAYGKKYGIYTDDVSSYVWHSGLAVSLGLLVFISITARRTYDGVCARALLWIAAKEYGIYIWHYIVMENILEHSEILQVCRAKGSYFIILIIQLAASVATGSLLSGGIGLLTQKWLYHISERSSRKDHSGYMK